MGALTCSNPVLSEERLWPALQQTIRASTNATVGGVVFKTAISMGLAAMSGAVGYSLAKNNPGLVMVAGVVSFVASLAVFFALRGRPAWAAFLCPAYAIVQGFMLGAFAMVLDGILAAQGISLPGGVAAPAFLMTVGVATACLVLYRSGVVRLSERGTFVLGCVVMGIAIAYGISFVLGMFGVAVPFLSLPTETGTSTGAWIGLGINGVILVVAALTLVADIGQVDRAVANGTPKSSEWYLAFGLVASLVWIYIESMKIVFRLAMMFGKRD